MPPYTLSYLSCEAHELFISSVIVEYRQKVVKRPIVNFGRIYLVLLYGEFTVKNCNGKLINNPQIQLKPVSNYFFLSAEKGSKMVMVSMEATRWYAITGKPATGYNEQVLDMASLLPSELLEPLYRQISTITDAADALAVFDHYLSGYYKAWCKPNPLDELVAEIFEKQGMVTLSYLLEKYPFARSTLGLYFRKYIGYSPKFFIRLVHFNNIIREMESNGSRLSELIRQYHFYDYAHFKRDFQIFTGVIPTEYEGYNHELLKEILAEIDY